MAAMSKSKRITRTIALPLATVHEVVTSERYLLTTDKMVDPGDTEIVEAQRELLDDGRVWARVVVQSADAASSGANSGDQPREKASTSQVTTVHPVGRGGRFISESDMELPASLGTVNTVFEYLPVLDEESGAEVAGRTRCEVDFSVDIDMPLIGGKLANHLLAKSEETVGNGIARIEALARELSR